MSNYNIDANNVNTTLIINSSINNIENCDLKNKDTIILNDIILFDKNHEHNDISIYFIDKVKQIQIKNLQISGVISYVNGYYSKQALNYFCWFIKNIYENTNIKNIYFKNLKKKIECCEYGLHEDTYYEKIVDYSPLNITEFTNFLVKNLTKYIYNKHIYNERHNKEMPPILNLQIYNDKFDF